MALSEIIRPNATGDRTEISEYVGSATHYLNVDEEKADDDTTLVKDSTSSSKYDLYHIESPTKFANLTIAKIRVYGRFKVEQDSDVIRPLHDPEFIIQTSTTAGSQKKYFVQQTQPPLFVAANTWWTEYRELAENPTTSVAWTRADLDILQIGCGLLSPSLGAGLYEYCTQLYVEVFYEQNVFPTDAITRVQGLTHIADRTPGRKPKYLLQVHLGGLVAFDEEEE